MLKFYGANPPARLTHLQVGGYCPHCKTGTRFKLTTQPIAGVLRADNADRFVANYNCEICLGPIPVQWHIRSWAEATDPEVYNPKVTLPMKEEFDFEHVPDSVKSEIQEALDCLSVQAYNGFAAVCRRSVQAISTQLGAQASTKVKKQIEEMAQVAGLDDEIKVLALQIMLAGHDGAHPDLPEVNAERASVLLTLLRDLTYELFTRPGKVKKAEELRKEAIAAKKAQVKS